LHKIHVREKARFDDIAQQKADYQLKYLELKRRLEPQEKDEHSFQFYKNFYRAHSIQCMNPARLFPYNNNNTAGNTTGAGNGDGSSDSGGDNTTEAGSNGNGSDAQTPTISNNADSAQEQPIIGRTCCKHAKAHAAKVARKKANKKAAGKKKATEEDETKARDDDDDGVEIDPELEYKTDEEIEVGQAVTMPLYLVTLSK